jgi:hypothetical protein
LGIIITMNIFQTFELFFKEPLSILREGLIQIVNVNTNIFSQKSSVNVDFVNNKAQITVVNNEKVYNLLQTVTYKRKQKELEEKKKKTEKVLIR